MAVHLPRRRFNVTEYYQMAKAGIFNEDDRVELIEGEIIEMSPIGRAHAAYVLRLNQLFARMFADVALVNVQNPIRLSEYNEPQPDVTLLRPRADFYAAHHPHSEDILLVVEVADTSMAIDRRVKMPLYARSGIPEAWLIDVNRETVTVYREPGPTGYGTRRVMQRGERLAPDAFPDREIAVEEMVSLPRI